MKTKGDLSLVLLFISSTLSPIASRHQEKSKGSIMMIRKTAPKSTRRSKEDMKQVPAQKMEDFKGCYTMSSQQMEITEVAVDHQDLHRQHHHRAEVQGNYSNYLT